MHRLVTRTPYTFFRGVCVCPTCIEASGGKLIDKVYCTVRTCTVCSYIEQLRLRAEVY